VGDDAGGSEVEIAEAVIVHPAPTLQACDRIDAGEGTPAGLYAVDQQWFAFYAEGFDPPILNVRLSELSALDFGDARNVLAGATKADLIKDGTSLKAVASRQLYAVLLESDDGSEWTDVTNLAPDEPNYACEGYPPARLFRGASPVEFIAMGHDFNSGIFGCTERLFVSQRTGEQWNVPENAGKGDAVFAYHGTSQLTVISTSGVYATVDGGHSFSKQSGGDKTNEQLKGTGGAWTGSRLLLVQSYSFANEYAIALVISEDEGASWLKRVLLTTSTSPLFNPLLAASGERLAVTWNSSGKLWLMTSPDGGGTWSERGQFDDPNAAQAMSATSVAVSGSMLGVMGAADGVRVCIGAP